MLFRSNLPFQLGIADDLKNRLEDDADKKESGQQDQALRKDPFTKDEEQNAALASIIKN